MFFLTTGQGGWKKKKRDQKNPTHSPTTHSLFARFLQMSYKPQANGALMQALALPKAKRPYCCDTGKQKERLSAPNGVASEVAAVAMVAGGHAASPDPLQTNNARGLSQGLGEKALTGVIQGVYLSALGNPLLLIDSLIFLIFFFLENEDVCTE